MRRLYWHLISISLASLLAATTQHAEAQQLFRCKGEKGQITFSDRGCPVSAKEAARRPVPTAKAFSEKPNGGVEKLTPANVEDMIQHANATVTQGDHRAQCALLAPDLQFTVTDHSTSPPLSMAGGRSKLCEYMNQSAQMLRMSGASGSSTLGKVTVNVHEEGQLATAQYTTVQKVSAQGLPTFTVRCTQEDQVGLYNGTILFNRSAAICKPV